MGFNFSVISSPPFGLEVEGEDRTLEHLGSESVQSPENLGAGNGGATIIFNSSEMRQSPPLEQWQSPPKNDQSFSLIPDEFQMSYKEEGEAVDRPGEN